MTNIITIPGGIILRGQDRLFAFDQFISGYSIISETQAYVEFEDGVLVFDCTDVSVNDTLYNPIEEFIAALGL